MSWGRSWDSTVYRRLFPREAGYHLGTSGEVSYRLDSFAESTLFAPSSRSMLRNEDIPKRGAFRISIPQVARGNPNDVWGPQNKFLTEGMSRTGANSAH